MALQDLAVIVAIQDRALAVFKDIQEVVYQAFQVFQDTVARAGEH